MNKTSLTRLSKVHPDLQKVIALADTRATFEITEGERKLTRQKELYESGASATMRSRHVRESNQCYQACAVDLVVMVGKEARWDWPLYSELAKVVREASIELGVPMEWGGVWDKEMAKYKDPAAEMLAYVERKKAEFKLKGIKRAPFVDGPHFQLAWRAYP